MFYDILPQSEWEIRSKHKKMAQVDERVKEAYTDVRSDASATQWALFGYDPSNKKKIVVQATGSGDWNEFTSHLKDNEAQFGFVRFLIPADRDSETKRSKFVFVSWVGTGVGRLARGQVSVHKASVKDVVRDFAVEIHGEERSELEEEKVVAQVIKAGGANYGTGSRD